MNKLKVFCFSYTIKYFENRDSSFGKTGNHELDGPISVRYISLLACPGWL
jgi:hypothetical protein